MISGHLDVARALPLQALLDGPRDGVPVLLLTGLGQQAIDWPQPIIDLLLESKCRVIRPDHRDAGLSPLCGEAIDPHLTIDDFPDASPLAEPPAYDLRDMAADALALMDRLELPAAHLIGYSMGGMIAQILASLAPHRVLSLTSLMSSGGQKWIDCHETAWLAMAGSIVAIVDIDERRRHYEADMAVFAGPGYPMDLVLLKKHAEIALARSYRPSGTWRQIRAVRGTGERRKLLQSIQARTLIVHGTADNCIAFHQAEEAQSLIPGSHLIALKEAGHDLHPDLIPLFCDELRNHLLIKR